MITLNFYTIEEKQPKFNEEVILILKRHSFGYSGFEPVETIIEFLWEEYDEEGLSTGDYINYSEDDSEEEMLKDNYRLVMVDQQSGTFLDKDNCLWCPMNEFYDKFK